MPYIESFDSEVAPKEKFYKRVWNYFASQNKFTKISIVAILLLIITIGPAENFVHTITNHAQIPTQGVNVDEAKKQTLDVLTSFADYKNASQAEKSQKLADLRTKALVRTQQ